MRKTWKKGVVTALSMALAVSNCIPAMAATGWREDASGWYYENSDGSLQKGWLQDVDGIWYFLDNASGVMRTGWVQDVDSTWYYMTGSGAMQTGWVNDNGTWYYTNGSGAMQTGWVNDNGTWYYTNASGAMQTGWVSDNGTWYYMAGSGAMQTGWVNDNGTYYYMNASGAMQTGTIVDNGKTYSLNASGAWDGKAGVSIASSTKLPSGSSSSGSSSTTTASKGWTYSVGTKTLTVSGLKKGVTITEDDLKNKTIEKVVIKDTVKDGEVTLDGLDIKGDLEINGGGSESVTIKSCTIKGNVIANKKSGSPVRIAFEGNTTVEKEVQANGLSVIIDISGDNVQISAVVVTAPTIVLKGSAVKGGKLPLKIASSACTMITIAIPATVSKADNVDLSNTEVTVDKTVADQVEVPEEIKEELKDYEDGTTTDDTTTTEQVAPTVDSITVSGSAVTVTDNAATATVNVATGSSIKLSDIALSGSAKDGSTPVEGTFTWTDATVPVGGAATEQTITFAPTNTEKYKTVTIKVTLTVSGTK